MKVVRNQLVAEPLASAIETSHQAMAFAGAMRMHQEANDNLTRPLLDAVDLFDALGIRYALIGGLAAMVYGRARFTLDVDFVAQPDHQDLLKTHPDVMRRHHFDPSCTWKLYHDSGGEVDLWKDEHAEGIVGRARTQTLVGRPVRVVEPHDLIAMKLRADRPQDDYDISEIVRHTTISDSTVRERVTAEQYERYKQIKRRMRR